jgi:hypothetical protein
MNRNILCGLLLALAFTTACAQQKKGVKSKVNETAKKPAPAIVTKRTSDITSIRMSRTACFGKCPEYTLTLSLDGKATYQGRRFTKYQGTYEKQFESTQVYNLFKEFERYKVDTCKDKYEAIPDMAGMDYELVYRSKDDEKVIKNANSPMAPKFLKGLADEMDKQFPIDGSWKKTENWEEPKR